MDKQGHAYPMVLIKGNSDEISNKVQDKRMELWQEFEQQYMQTLGNF